jgi:hypothetical protein
MPDEGKGSGVAGLVWIIAGLLVIVLAVLHIFLALHTSSVSFSTPYQAVLLTNGSVYFGKMQSYGTSHPVLTDVFYVQSSMNPETKQTTNVLVKRGKELHAPDRMYLNPSQIILVEPVGPTSKVAQLIAEQKSQQ